MAGHGELKAEVEKVLSSTLAWQQFTDSEKLRWRSVAQISLGRFESALTEQRRRWSRAGTSLGTTAILERIAEDFANAAVANGQRYLSPVDWIRQLLGDGTIEELILLSENQSFRAIRRRPSSSWTDVVEVDYVEMLARWVGGEGLNEIASDLLGAIEDADYRADAITEFVSAVFEHHLPWVMRLLINWANASLSEEFQLPSDMPLYIQHGVGTPSGLELMVSGVRSRRLSMRVSAVLGDYEPDLLKSRLSNMTVELWREHFHAAATDLRDLLGFVHDPSLRTASRFLRGEPIQIDLELGIPPDLGADLYSVRAEQGPEPRPWYFRTANSNKRFAVRAESHNRLEAILDLGLPVEVERSAGGVLLHRHPDSFIPSERN